MNQLGYAGWRTAGRFTGTHKKNLEKEKEVGKPGQDREKKWLTKWPNHSSY